MLRQFRKLSVYILQDKRKTKMDMVKVELFRPEIAVTVVSEAGDNIFFVVQSLIK